MRIERLGEGTPEVAVVGAIHGDEPCGARAVERLLAQDPAVQRPVALIVANEQALARGVRYVDADLNRAFGGVEGDGHEHGLARRLAEELSGCLVLSIHSTQSHDEPFGIVEGAEGPAAEVAPSLSIRALVETGATGIEGRPFALDGADVLEVEAGHQGSPEAAENAHRLAREFLVATGALDESPVARELPRFALGDSIEKPPADAYEVFAENFERVEAGEAFAAADGEPIRAERAFHPVLLSADGYEDIFGYAGERLGTLRP